MTDELFVSVVVCTRNRSASLGRMLRSLVAMDKPSDLSWELVVVDNGSSDNTSETVQSFSDRLPIKRVFEPVAGISSARNAGVSAARGKYICWIDDDVEVVTGWLNAYLSAFEAHPTAAYFAGRVKPLYEGERPRWMIENMDVLSVAYAERDFGNDPRPLAEGGSEDPFNANCAIMRSWQNIAPYHLSLGLSPNFRRLGEETAVFRTIKAAGGIGFWVPDAEVAHHIPQHRQTMQYVTTYQMSVGETWAALTDLGMDNFMGPPLERTGKLILGAPVWLWRLTAQSKLLSAVSRFRGQRKRLTAVMRYAYYRGALDYLIRSRPAPVTAAD